MQIIGIDYEYLYLRYQSPQELNEPSIILNYINSNEPEKTLSPEFLKNLPKPWLVIEDSAHFYDTTFAILSYFDKFLTKGDYIVVEDGVVADFTSSKYDPYEDGPNRAIHDFLEKFGERYQIDTDLCDFFGHNLTYCPNSWLKVIQ